MSKTMVIAVATLFGCLLVSTLAGQSPSAKPSVVKWEHMAMHVKVSEPAPKTARAIHKVQDAGWELVDVETYHEAGTTVKTVYFFKRQQ